MKIEEENNELINKIRESEKENEILRLKEENYKLLKNYYEIQQENKLLNDNIKKLEDENIKLKEIKNEETTKEIILSEEETKLNNIILSEDEIKFRDNPITIEINVDYGKFIFKKGNIIQVKYNGRDIGFEKEYIVGIAVRYEYEQFYPSQIKSIKYWYYNKLSNNNLKNELIKKLGENYSTIKEYVFVPNYKMKHNIYVIDNWISFSNNMQYIGKDNYNHLNNILVSKNELFTDVPELVKYEYLLRCDPNLTNDKIKIFYFVGSIYDNMQKEYENIKSNNVCNNAVILYEALELVYPFISNIIFQSISKREIKL